MLPRAGLNEASREKDLTQLHAVIRYIGSVFSPSQSTPTFLEAANNALLVQAPPKNGFTVQALLLFAIALHSHAVDDRAFGILEHATDIALEIGMNKQEYAWVNGEDRQCWEESWRRTWWELYVMNGIFAAIHQRETFRLLHVECDVALPCEENDYIARIVSVGIPLTEEFR